MTNSVRRFDRKNPGRLRILFLTNRSPYPIKDGQSRRTYNILRGLARRHEVFLLSLYQSPDEIEAERLKHLETFCKEVEMLPAPKKSFSLGMATRLLASLFSLEPYTIWRHYSPKYARRVRASLDARSFDVIHCDILPLAYCVRDLNSSFCVLTDHDVSYIKARRLAVQNRNPAMKLFMHYEALKLECLERRIFRKVNLGIAVSELDRRHLQALCPSGRFAVIENGVDVRTFVPAPKAPESDTLIWIGGFGDYYNYEAIFYFLNEIYPGIKGKTTGIKFYVVGGNVPDRLANVAARDSSIVATGHVEDPLPYLQRASVFVAPILSGGGTKLKVLEAMAAGKAIVSTSVGVEGIEANDGEHFLVADDPKVFSARVVSLLKEPDLRERLGANARLLTERKYDWTAICDRASQIYIDAFQEYMAEPNPVASSLRSDSPCF
jgi:glycosyltransferase involved in cell wall biosynthesis